MNPFKRILFFLISVWSSKAIAQYDVVIYGATASGVTAAVAAARDGAKVVLIEPGKHIGGMVTGGLSHTDYGDQP
jgi:ribulose 1,5-bisphosphate synthetase/thiazole synthase